MHGKLRAFLNSKKLVDPEARGLTYGDGPSGSKPLLQSLAGFFNKHWHPNQAIIPRQIMATNGVTAAIEHSVWALLNPGEGVLLGRPYYRAFLPDISLRTGAKVVPVAFGSIDPLSMESVSMYEETLLASNEKGVKIRAIMLCHPHNPLGRCYSKDAIISFMKLCQKYKIHLISDEIYALSVWANGIDELKTPPVDFQSVLSIDSAGLIDSELIHVLWGTSKDFGANGIRLGVIISQNNTEFLTACRACALYSAPSSLAENAVIEILNDASFLNSYINENQGQLSTAYTHACRLLKNHGIPYRNGVNAAFFLWVNLGRIYTENHPEALFESDESGVTKIIFEKLMERRIFLVHGEAAGSEEPGWFRLVFSQPAELVEEGIKRIADAIR